MKSAIAGFFVGAVILFIVLVTIKRTTDHVTAREACAVECRSPDVVVDEKKGCGCIVWGRP